MALRNAEQQMKSMESKLDSAHARYQSEKNSWEIDLQRMEETWRSIHLTELNIHVLYFLNDYALILSDAILQ